LRKLTFFHQTESINILLKETCKKHWKSDWFVTVNEVMQRFKSQLHDTLTILMKLTSEDYKIWVIADEDYVLVWIYHQRDKESLDVQILKKLESNKTVTMIADLLNQLFKQLNYVYEVFLNNLFTSHKLFVMSLHKANHMSVF